MIGDLGQGSFFGFLRVLNVRGRDGVDKVTRAKRIFGGKGRRFLLNRF